MAEDAKWQLQLFTFGVTSAAAILRLLSPEFTSAASTASNRTVGGSASMGPALVDLIHDLYSASVDNQRFFHGRLVDPTSEQNKYRELISEAVFPNPLGRKPIRIAGSVPKQI
jgi:hypothetical protein